MASGNQELLERGREVMALERDAVEGVRSRLDANFVRAIRLLKRCRGKVIVTGVGKSGIIAQKMAATLTSTGTPAFFLHPADALHGDLGIAQSGDVMILLSKSGNTSEIAGLLPSLKLLGLGTIAITGNPAPAGSLLARNATVVLDASVDREACSYDLAPTSSTTAMLALCDALAVVLYEAKGFTQDIFAATHPGGAIGRRLLLKIEEVMKKGDAVPQVGRSARFSDVVAEISRKRLGAVLVTGRNRLLGIITDGDLRRLLEREVDIYAMTAGEMMTPDPMVAPPDMPGARALVLLEQHKRTHLPVVERRGLLRGIVHLHDLVEAGLKG